MNNCTICGGPLISLSINNEYYKCEICETQIKKDTSPFNIDFYNDTYLNDIDKLKNTMLLSKNHYDQLFDLIKADVAFNDFFSAPIETTYCYGGGWPQIESYFIPREIIVCDLIAEKYKDMSYIFEKQFDTTQKQITYKNYNLDQGIIPHELPSIITFIHIFEHLSGDHIKKILQDINDNAVSGSYGFIYQPNPDTAYDKNWWHYAEEHITLISPNTMKNLITGYEKLIVTFTFNFSEDMLIIFRRM